VAVVFISYRRDDSTGYAGRLHESLERRLGAGEVFRDVDALQPGQDFVDAIADRLRACRACLVLIGRDWLNATEASGRRRLDQDGDYVRLEIAAALARSDVVVIPVLVEGAAMPAAEALPESIRALARRHAVSLRDEAWDADVDRLAAAVRRAAGIDHQPAPSPAIRPPAASLKWGLLAAAVIAAFILLRTFSGGEERELAPESEPAAVRDRAGQPAAGPASAIAMPRLPEAAHGSLIYTLLSGDVAPRNPGRLLRLRVRLANDSAYPANFWDASFRLAAAGQVLEPTSGLNEIVEGHAVKQGIVAFQVPDDSTSVVLRVLGMGMPAELSLDLHPTDAASSVDSVDTRDPLARAEVITLTRDARPIGGGNEISYTLTSATARRFVNTLRIVANLRVTNNSRYPMLFGSGTARLIADGQATAPIEAPNEAVAGNATAAGAFVFDLPPATRKAALRVIGESPAELPLDLP
jgi:hypothetical protein